MITGFSMNTPRVEKNSFDNRTVLFVDDEIALQKVTVAILKRYGFSVLTASDGIEALDAYTAHAGEIQLVICDICMPRMDGWETMEALRKLSPDLPIIVASG
jgi:two-component system, cell cycle sensor histidine kinase and response regulator CckA